MINWNNNELIKECDKNWRTTQTFMKCHPIKVMKKLIIKYIMIH